jgi:hypothetical protein
LPTWFVNHYGRFQLWWQLTELNPVLVGGLPFTAILGHIRAGVDWLVFHEVRHNPIIIRWSGVYPMHGVPADLPVQRFVGDTLFQVCIGVDGVHFVFGHAGTISVHGGWDLLDRDGNLVDGWQEHSERKSYQLHVIFNEDVTGCTIDPPHSFTLTFANGHRLTIYDDSPGYECFAIQPDDIYI